jgi:hypothetical protein
MSQLGHVVLAQNVVGAVPAPSIASKPILLVGDLKGLTPPTITMDNSGQRVDTSRVDFRRARGFPEALKRAISDLGYPEVADAEIKLVNSNKELLAAIRASGTRRVIYFGHALGFGALAPGGISVPTVDPKELDAAFTKGHATPIFLGCYSGAAPQVGAKSPGGAMGLRRFLKWEDTGVQVFSAHRNLSADDIRVADIKVSESGKAAAPQAPLPQRQPTAPP